MYGFLSRVSTFRVQIWGQKLGEENESAGLGAGGSAGVAGACLPVLLGGALLIFSGMFLSSVR